MRARNAERRVQRRKRQAAHQTELRVGQPEIGFDRDGQHGHDLKIDKLQGRQVPAWPARKPDRLALTAPAGAAQQDSSAWRRCSCVEVYRSIGVAPGEEGVKG